MAKSIDSYDYSDLTPVENVPSEQILAPIMYSNDYKHATSLLRAVMQKHEYSERGLALVEQVLDFNAAHYSAWEYRYRTLKHLSTNSPGKSPEFVEDADFINRMTVDNPKNYQVWNYRKHLYIPGSKEFLTNEKYAVELVLLDDEKNFHAWSHYRWIIQQDPKSELVSEALEFSAKFIERDVRNNSAWSFRFFLFEQNNGEQLLVSENEDKGFALEQEYVMSNIDLVPENEASWNYLVGIYENFKGHAALVGCKDICLKHQEHSSRALEVLAEIYLIEKDSGQSLECYATLESKVPIRKGYWSYKKQQVLGITES